MAQGGLMVSVSGIRGRVGDALTPDVVARYAAAFGAWSLAQGASRRIVVGRDSRVSGPMVHRIVVGTLQASTYGWLRSTQDFTIGSAVVIPAGGISPVWLFVLIGGLLLFWFFRHIAAMERAGKEPLLATRILAPSCSPSGRTSTLTP